MDNHPTMDKLLAPYIYIHLPQKKARTTSKNGQNACPQLLEALLYTLTGSYSTYSMCTLLVIHVAVLTQLGTIAEHYEHCVELDQIESEGGREKREGGSEASWTETPANIPESNSYTFIQKF